MDNIFSKSDSELLDREFCTPAMVELALKETGTAITIIDRDYNIRFLNKSWEEKYGSYKGKKCFEYFMGSHDRCVDCAAIQVFETGEVTISEEFLVKQGRLYQVIRKPFESSTGERLVAEIYTDITERRNAEENACTYQSIIEQSPVIIMLTDLSGKIRYVNPRFTEVTGYTSEEVIGKNPRILKSGEKTSGEYRELWNTIRAEKEWYGEFHNRKKNGELYWEYASICPLRNTKGQITGYVAIKKDITERKKIEEELRKAKEEAEVANNLKSRFLASVSHELRTPMNSILGFSRMLVAKSAHNLTEKQIKCLNMINQSGERLLELINNILDLARIEAGKTELEMEEFLLDGLITEIDYFTRGILKNRVDFTVRKEEGLPVKLYSDRKKILQILINLLSNAVKFTPEGEILLKIYKDEKNIVFSVKDTGIGIVRENLDIIFEDFKQIDTEEGKKHEGTGLGLAISKRLSHLLKAEISVESQYKIGSTFSLSIPYIKY